MLLFLLLSHQMNIEGNGRTKVLTVQIIIESLLRML